MTALAKRENSAADVLAGFAADAVSVDGDDMGFKDLATMLAALSGSNDPDIIAANATALTEDYKAKNANPQWKNNYTPLVTPKGPTGM